MPSTGKRQTETAPHPDFLGVDDLAALNHGSHPAPFSVLGPHKSGGKRWITTFQPDAVAVTVTVGRKSTLLPRIAGDVFSGRRISHRRPFRVRSGPV